MRIRKRRALAVLLFYGVVISIGALWVGSLSSANAAGARGGAGRGAGAAVGGRAGAAGAGAGAAARGGAASAPSAPPARGTAADGNAFFETKIRPVLVKECYGCHSADVKDVSGGLFLDTRQGERRGGTRGPAVVPGNVEASWLIKAMRYTDKDLQMPPSAKLADATIKDFESWIKMGAPDTRDGSAPVVKTYDTEAAKKWWAFQAWKRPATPKVNDVAWPRGDMDRFVLAGMDGKSIKPVADADKATLFRRLSFDLTGLPPSLADMDDFARDNTPGALGIAVDKLLASPQFGERWGRHWLDVARYGESTGKESNTTYPEAWRYRDYVIASFNADKPYDQFIKEQIAGDLMPTASPRKKAEQEIATGFLAIGPKGLMEQSARQFALDVADEQVATTAQAFMALTVACARCHDHKFDPILQKDYYGMAGIFLSTNTKFGTLAGPRNNHESDLIELPASANEPAALGNLAAADRAQLTKDLAAATADLTQFEASRGRGAPQGLAVQIQQAQGLQAHLQAKLNNYDATGKPKAFCMGVEDRPQATGRVAAMGPPDTRRGPLARQLSGFEFIADSPLFFRGEATEPRDRVPRTVPVFLAWSGASVIPQSTSGRRELANWIASAKNPLTARVMANRLWLWLMGQGIVASVDNFGTMGEAPTNQALLDYLAGRLMDNGWSIKKTIREIVMSRTYGLASTYDEGNYGIDPQNTLSWRHSPLRLDAECLRDAMLMDSGQMDLKPPVGSLVALAGNGAIAAGPAYMRINEVQFINATGVNRSVYLPAVRDLEPDAMGLFDYPDSNTINGDRDSTNVPSQALYLMNNMFVQNQARLMARRVINSFPGGPNQPVVQQNRIDFAFRTVFGRMPTDTEKKASLDFLARLATQVGGLPIEIWSDFCLSLYNTAEFRFLK